ncbi:alpha/beta fold hydrolase [Kitasatospora sp. NPDC097643]|uniref:thioesterase II family protein n=1 Tax=Kitasatospora sp. NPDC097643 TaxID=3157230 RepID=UPI003332B2B1
MLRHVARPAVRLFLFHHAGGSGTLFDGWAERLPADWDVVPLEAPGRGAKRTVPPCVDAAGLAEHFRQEIRPGTDVPYAFFGHSMGALVAHELAQRLWQDGEPGPIWLGLSSCVAPGRAGTVTARSGLSDRALQDWLVSLGGTPAEVVRHPFVWSMLGPVLRGDLRVVESWRPTPAVPPTGTPFTVFGSTDDDLVPVAQLREWQDVGDHVRIRLHQGGHFYLQARPEPLIDQIAAAVQACLTEKEGIAR